MTQAYAESVMRRRRERVFALIEAAAVARRRCPQNHEFAVINASGAVYALAADGQIRVEVYGKNWRVIEILVGRHEGRRTAKPPFDNDGPYKVIDSAGTHRPREKWNYVEL